MNFRHFLFLLACVSLAVPSSALAGVDRFTLDVYLNSGEENINTFGGVLHYPRSWSIDKIELQSPKLIYWIDPPGTDSLDSISFSGIVLGGVQNLGESSSKNLLYSIDFIGEDEAVLTNEVIIEEEEFYLSHPAALAATQGSFTYSYRDTNSYHSSGVFNGALDLSFSFEEDPVTGGPTLVLDSYRGDLASYTFSAKEGDFNFGEWSSVDGVQALNSPYSTIKLSILDSEGAYETLLLRRSPLRLASGGLMVALFVGMIFYLFKAALDILRFKPRSVKASS